MKVKVLHSETQAALKELNLSHAIADGETCFVGRAQSSGLLLDSSRVSRLHGQFSRQDGQYYFSDLGSSNGSTIQGTPAIASQPYLLHPGDVIRIGEFILMLEAIPEQPEELDATVVGGLDETVVGGFAIPTIVEPDQPEPQEVLEVEVLPLESSALVKVEPQPLEPTPMTQTQALFAAINQRVISELKAAGNLTRDTYLKAIQRAKDSVENKRLIDPEQFEKEADKHWQSIAKGTSELGGQLGTAAIKGASEVGKRLGAAAKAAWKGFLAPPPANSESQEPDHFEANEEPSTKEQTIETSVQQDKPQE